MRLYEYAVIAQAETNGDGKEISAAYILVPPTTVLAKDEAQAQLLAGRAIPEGAMDKLDHLTVVVRPF